MLIYFQRKFSNKEQFKISEQDSESEDDDDDDESNDESEVEEVISQQPPLALEAFT